ncbi:hypothetical protein [Huginn virus]|nr:hypothetical protein [Huginn virus]
MSTLGNVLDFQPGETKRLKFQSYALRPMTIEDPTFKVPKTINVLSLLTSEINGEKKVLTWNIASDRLAANILPYIRDGTYTRRIFTVTKHGSGSLARYEIQVGPPE